MLLFFQCWCHKDVLHEGLSCKWVDLVLSVFWQSSEIAVFSEGVPVGSSVDQEVSPRVHVDINITRHVSSCAFLEALGLSAGQHRSVGFIWICKAPPFTGIPLLRHFCGFSSRDLWAGLQSCDRIKLQAWICVQIDRLFWCCDHCYLFLSRGLWRRGRGLWTSVNSWALSLLKRRNVFHINR